MAPASPETISVLGSAKTAQTTWEPVVGAETTALFDEAIKLDKEGRTRVIDEARRVLGRCLSPKAKAGSETGLVIGYVQSGKTMSFTTVAALARDNGFNLIILIAGTSSYLLDQSTNRLHKDLRIDTRNDRKWRTFQTSTWKTSDRDALRESLASWADPTLPEAMKRTVLITAMKNHTHLEKLASELRPLDLKHIRALVIDDEADQASLNALVNAEAESTTYTKLNALRACLPHHSFLQYTATPQAPLLINIIDRLAPRFAEVLTPGRNYVGGKAFFIDRPELVIDIPDDDVPKPKKPLREPPESLHRAMQLFFVGVAAGLVRDKGAGNRSMMVHPSQTVAKHALFYQWVTAARDSWKSILDPAKGLDADRAELLEEFQRAHSDLSETVPDLPAWSAIQEMLRHAIRETRVEKVNATADAADEIKWKDAYAWILVGGQAMDRGFTVEGLTVTYMPREVGVGNADTVQQRGRFFGYKRDVLGYCRVFLSAGARGAFTRYVSHEEDVRGRLLAFRDSGKPLTEWKRVFYLAKELRPTRVSVLDLEYFRSSAGESWMDTDRPQTGDIPGNLRVVNEFRESIKGILRINAGSPERTEYQKHLIATIPLRRIVDEVLPRLSYTDPADSAKCTLLSISLAEELEDDPKAECTVFFMSAWKKRMRGIDGKKSVKNLFQGAAPVEGSRRGSIYPGDREVAQGGPKFAIQFHHLELTEKKGDKDVVVVPSVVAMAFYAAKGLGRDLLVQDQPGRRVRRGA